MSIESLKFKKEKNWPNEKEASRFTDIVNLDLILLYLVKVGRANSPFVIPFLKLEEG